MTQQVSPFIEGKYGWDFGEGGWNVGMDENLLKFSFLFDGNVDGIVSSLPAASDGASYFLSTDNRFYFAIKNTYYSSPVPENYVFSIKSSGALFKYKSGSLTQQASTEDLESQLVELSQSFDEGLTPLNIKTLYESNEDTNDFTDAEKSKLSTLTATPPVDGVEYLLKDRQWIPYTGGSSDVKPSSLFNFPAIFIPTVSATKFGDMTQGRGLEAIFDFNSGTAGRREQTTGYAGVSLSNPQAALSFDLVSSDNGYDGSSASSSVTLSVYGKNGAVPASATDGTLLATETFLEGAAGEYITKTLINTQPSTSYTHYWAVVTTPVWAVLSQFRIRVYQQPFQQPAVGAMSTYTASCNDPVALLARIPGFPTSGLGEILKQTTIPIILESPRVLNIDFHADVVHVGQGADAGIAVGYGFQINYRSGATQEALAVAPWVPIKNAVGGGNVSEVNPQHYGNKSICTAIQLPAGFHEISCHINGHTDGSTNPGLLKMLVENGSGLNCLRVNVLP